MRVAWLAAVVFLLLSGCSSSPDADPPTDGASRSGPMAASPAAPAPLVFTTHIDAPDPGAPATQECVVAIVLVLPNLVLGGTPADGRFGAIFPLPSNLAGAPFALEPSADLQVRWADEQGVYVGGTATSGTVPEDAEEVHVCSVGPAGMDVDVTLTITPSPAPSTTAADA